MITFLSQILNFYVSKTLVPNMYLSKILQCWR